MKPKLVLLAVMFVLTFSAAGQYTPLPPLNHADFENFVSLLKQKADELALPELETIADNMTYDEARRFMANPHVFLEKLKNEVKPEEKTTMDKIRIGIVVNFLLNYLGGLTGDYKSMAQIGYSLGLYAMFVFGSVYLMPELLFMYRPAGEKYGSYKNVLKITYLMLFTNVMYAFGAQHLRWLLGGGPALGFGLTAKEKNTSSGGTSQGDLEFGENGLQRFQAGINLQAGLLLRNKFLFYIAYTYFFTKVYAGNSDIAMHSLRLGFGYTFGGH